MELIRQFNIFIQSFLTSPSVVTLFYHYKLLLLIWLTPKGSHVPSMNFCIFIFFYSRNLKELNIKSNIFLFILIRHQAYNKISLKQISFPLPWYFVQSHAFNNQLTEGGKNLAHFK